nr:hypothetical protein [Tanacetum cinerariifolium]
MFEDLEHKSVVVEVNKHKVVVFTKAPPKDYSEPFMRFSTPFIVDGQGAWDAELYLAYSDNYITKEMLGKLGFVRLNYGEYGRRMVKEACVEIHGFTFLVDFVVIDYADEGEPPVMFERDFLVTTKCKIGYQAFLANFLVLDIPVDKELPLSLGRSLLVQLKNTDWGSDGHEMYKKTEGDGAWHEKFKMEYRHEDGDEFVYYSWERAFSIKEDVYREWCLEFFLTMYFERKVDRTMIIKEKCIWFRLCGEEHVFTLPEFAVILGLILVGALVHRTRSKEKCQKEDLWMMSILEEGRFAKAVWIIVEYLCKKSPRIKENSDIYGGHYVPKILKALGYYVDEEVAKFSEPIEYEDWTDKIGGHYGDHFTGTRTSYGGNSIVPNLGYKIGELSIGVQDNDDDEEMSDQMVRSKKCMGSGDEMDDIDVENWF